MLTVEATFRESRVAALLLSCVPGTLGFSQPRISNPWFIQSVALQSAAPLWVSNSRFQSMALSNPWPYPIHGLIQSMAL